MISASLVVEGHGHSSGGGPHHMTYVELGSSTTSKTSEFLRPLPKPSRYNGGPLNGCRVVPTQPGPRVTSAISKYHQPQHEGAVNLVQHKEESPRNGEDLSFSHHSYSSRLYPPPPPPPPPQVPSYHYPNLPGPYGSLYPGHYNPLLSRSSYPPPPIEAYRHSPPQQQSTPSSPGAAFLPFPTATYSPPGAQVKPGQSLLLRDRRPFKVPSGKEGSLKHRILTRPPPNSSAAPQPPPSLPPPPPPTTTAAENLTSVGGGKRRALGYHLPPPAPPPSHHHNNNNTIPPNFTKGSLIQLANGELKRVEDMTTEDFVSSAEKCPELRLDPSKVERIEENVALGTVRVTLSYGEHRTQVDIESTLEHPFFVIGQGWASCSPERTLECYGLKCHRLKINDICISLTPRPSPHNNNNNNNNNNVPMTSARNSAVAPSEQPSNAPQGSKTRTVADNFAAGHPRKRRWSAPDQFCNDEDEVMTSGSARKTKD